MMTDGTCNPLYVHSTLWCYYWKSKGHINVTPYGISLDLPHSDNEKKGVGNEEIKSNLIGKKERLITIFKN